MRTKLINSSGSILLEGCFLLFTMLLTVVIQLELVRKIWVGVFLQYSAFESVRKNMLSHFDTKEARDIQSHMVKLFPFMSSKSSGFYQYYFKVNRNGADGILSAHYHAKYRSFIQMTESDVKKKNFEVSEACRFPYLSR